MAVTVETASRRLIQRRDQGCHIATGPTICVVAHLDDEVGLNEQVRHRRVVGPLHV